MINIIYNNFNMKTLIQNILIDYENEFTNHLIPIIVSSVLLIDKGLCSAETSSFDY